MEAIAKALNVLLDEVEAPTEDHESGADGEDGGDRE